MRKLFDLFSILSLVSHQILVINGVFEPMQSPKKGFIFESRMGQFMQIQSGDIHVQINQRMFQSCNPRPLFGFKFFETDLDQLPNCPFPDVPPLIERTYKNISVTAGQKIRFDVVFTGYPKPVVTFFKSGIQLTADPRIQLSDRLIIEKAILEDSGLYTMVAQNPIGSDRIEFFVKVDPSAVTPPPSVCPPKVEAFIDSNAIYNESYYLIWYKVNAPDLTYQVIFIDLIHEELSFQLMLARVSCLITCFQIEGRVIR